MTPELLRPVSVDRLPAAFTVEATESECAALAARLRIPAVRSLWCRFTLRRRGEIVDAAGELRAEVVQDCVVTLDPVEQTVSESFAVRFVPQGQERDDEDPESPDELGYVGSSIDLGEATAEQLALSLDPYPRAEGAEMDPAGTEEEASPFSALRRLRPDG